MTWIESTSEIGTALRTSCTDPPMPRPRASPVCTVSSRLFVSTSPPGEASSIPASSAPLRACCCLRAPSASPTPRVWGAARRRLGPAARPRDQHRAHLLAFLEERLHPGGDFLPARTSRRSSYVAGRLQRRASREGQDRAVAGAGTPTGWRIVLISMVLPVAEPLIAHLRDRARACCLAHGAPQGRRHPAPAAVGEVTDSKAPPASPSSSPGTGRGRALLRGLEPDLVLCWGFSWKLPQEALDVPRLGSVNHHPGLLPRHRAGRSARLGAPRGRRAVRPHLAPHGRRVRHGADPPPRRPFRSRMSGRRSRRWACT